MGIGTIIGAVKRCLREGEKVQPLTYVSKQLSVSAFSVHPRFGCENVAKMCAPFPDTNLCFANLRLGNL